MKNQTMNDESQYIRKEGCPKCGSSDANAIYSDGHTYCFSCNTHKKGEDMGVTKIKRNVPYFNTCLGQPLPLIKRGINQETASFWDYHVAEYNGRPCQVAFYKDAQRTVVGQKIRFEDKEFICQGDFTESPLFGQHLWRDGGKMVTVVEGELDALSLSQAFQNRWAVVSIRSGAAGAKRDIRDAIDWLEKFDSVIFMFDMDDVGQKAAKECSQLLTPSKAKIAQLPLKDANEMLLAGRTKELIDAVWSAKVHRPDGIISGGDLWTAITENKNVESIPYPYNGINQKTHGMRRGEIVTITAGSGVGKSQLTREIAHTLIHADATLGYIALEESVKRTALGLLSLELNKPLHLGTEEVDNADLWRAFSQSLGNNSVFLYDHFGSSDSENLLTRIRYLSVGCSCSHIILDHLSIVVSGLEGGDERRIIDNTMTKLRTLAEELQVCIILVSHLKRPSGDKGHEDGAITSMSQLRGSAAIGQLSDIVIGLERNQQDKDNPNLTTVRILKNRWTGETGIACHLLYSKETGRMTETVFEEEDF
jgi:twinkle protein